MTKKYRFKGVDVGQYDKDGNYIMTQAEIAQASVRRAKKENKNS